MTTPTPTLSLDDMRQILLEEERHARLEERVLALIGLDDDKKRSANFPEGVVADGITVPLAILNNRLCQLSAFAGLSNAERMQWVKDNLALVSFEYVSKEDARARYGCGCELVRLDA